MIETLNLTFSDIHPFVRYVQRLSVSPDNYPVFTRPYDCRLFFVHVGSGRLYIGNEIWELKHGDVVLWQCGEHYHMDSKTTDGMYFLGTNFDYTQAYRYKDYPIPPDRSDRFKESEAMKRVHFVDNAEFDHPMLVHNMHNRLKI